MKAPFPSMLKIEYSKEPKCLRTKSNTLIISEKVDKKGFNLEVKKNARMSKG